MRLWVLWQVNSLTDDLTEDEVLHFRVEGLIAGEGQVDRLTNFCAPTNRILTKYSAKQLDAVILFESRTSNYGTDNFVKAKEKLIRANSSTCGDSR